MDSGRANGSADRSGAADLESRFGQRAITAWELANGPGQLAKGCHIVVDRAQLIDIETMTQTLERVREAGGAVTLTGDPGGHGPVNWEAGAGTRSRCWRIGVPRTIGRNETMDQPESGARDVAGAGRWYRAFATPVESNPGFCPGRRSGLSPA